MLDVVGIVCRHSRCVFSVVLPPGTGRVEIDFAAVEISAPEKIRMQYRLDGVDSEWLDAGPVPRATYSTLPPGPHTLRIRATNRSGVWDREGVVFTVTQQPFFYQTGWFAAAMASAACWRSWRFIVGASVRFPWR